MTIQKPDTTVHIDEIKFDNNQYFASGKYNLNEDMGDSISSTIDDILAQGGIISGIQVESSTDKQGLSIRLQNELKGIGYSGDNTGLSKARCEQITDYLVGLGVDSSLVTSNQVVGGGTVKYFEGRHEVKHSIPTWQKSIDLLDFEHKTDLKEGLTKMWEWAQKQPKRDRFVWSEYELEKGIYSFWKNKTTI